MLKKLSNLSNVLYRYVEKSYNLSEIKGLQQRTTILQPS